MRPLSKIILTASVLMLGTGVADADNGNQSGSADFKQIVLNPGRPVGHRHNAPSKQSVMCTYDDGNLYFEFAIPEGECQLILSDLSTGEVVAADFDSAMSEPIYIGYHSTASLTVTTANGHTYTGEW